MEIVLAKGQQEPLKSKRPCFTDGTHELDKAREDIIKAMMRKNMKATRLAIEANVDWAGLHRFLRPDGRHGKGKNVTYELVARVKRALEIV